MSRAVVLDAIKSDTTLLSMVSEERILVNPLLDGRPANFGGAQAFLVLKWEEQEVAPVFFESMAKGPRVLTIWAHYPQERSTDYVRLDNILHRVKEVLCALEDTAGADGYTLVDVSYQGDSSDMRDPALQTICRNATFKVLSRKTS